MHRRHCANWRICWAQTYVEQQWLLYGDCKVRSEADKVLNRSWFEVVSVVPTGMRPVRPTGDKVQRADPVAAIALGGRVKVKRAPWSADFLSTLHGFPDLPHDNDVDALSDAFTEFVAGAGGIVAAHVVVRERVEGLLG